jgi:hypothetical protein
MVFLKHKTDVINHFFFSYAFVKNDKPNSGQSAATAIF